MERDSMVFYRSFIECIVKLEEQFDSETAMQLVKTIAYYALDGELKELPPIIDLMFTSIKPQIDANTKRFIDGKKGGRPKKTTGYKDSKPLVTDEITTGYETTKPLVTDKITTGYESENHRLLNSKPNVNVNVNDNVNENVNKNVNKNVLKEKNNFSIENLTNKHNQIKRDFQIDSFPKLRKSKDLNKAFLTWLIYRKENSLFGVEAHLKTFIKLIKDAYTTESIILAVDHAILNNHSSIHPKDKIPEHMIYKRIPDHLNFPGT
jgi:hypothetical protein